MLKIQQDNFFQVNSYPIDADFTLRQNKLNQLIGENGIGKSTLIEHLKISPQFQSDFAYIDQFPLCPVSSYTVNDLVKVLSSEIKSTLSLDDVNQKYNLEIKPLLSKEVSFLSGGEQQLLKLTLGLLLNKRNLILDEPFQYLDKEKVKTLQEILKQLVIELDYVLIIEHNQDYLSDFDIHAIKMQREANKIKVTDGN
jgi:ABC-type Mn2+/Zn2+ transport system ATPase subunit